MKNKQWQAIHEVFSQIEALCAPLKAAADEAFPEREETPASGDGVDGRIVRVRKDVRTRLEFLRVQLAETLTERETYLVLFPIVIYFDELVQYRYLHAGQSWPPLQRELYQIDDGGVLFYETLDDILGKPQTLPFIYEVFYFCISHGFRGRYNDDPVKISAYQEKLKDRILVEEKLSRKGLPECLNAGSAAGKNGDAGTLSDDSLQIKTFGSPAWYYAAAGVVFGLCLILLKLYAGSYVKPLG